MNSETIIQLARNYKDKYGDDPLKICEILNIKINYINLKPTVYPAYTLSIGNKKVININNKFTNKSQKVLCAHELGHALLHDDKLINQFKDNHNGNYEFEANLFAVALLFNEEDFNVKFNKLDNYILQGILDSNIELV